MLCLKLKKHNLETQLYRSGRRHHALMRYEFLNEIGNDELLIPNKLTKYMKAISNVDFIKLFKAIKFVIDSKYIK
jgi:hypothetical protein